MKITLKKITMATLCMGLLAQGALAADVTLRFSWWGASDRHEATNKAIKAFEAKNPGVTIKGEYMGYDGYVDKLSTQMVGGVEPDIMQLDWAWISQFSKDGNGFYDLKQSKALQLDDFVSQSWKTGVVNGKLNAVPVSFTARVFLMNKSTWDKAGLPLPKTWDELFAAGKIFEQKLGKDYYPMDGQLNDTLLMAQSYMWQKTGKPWIYPNQPKVAYTEAEAMEWVKVFKKMIADHVVPPQQYRVSAGGGHPETPTEQMADWVTGKFAGDFTWDSTFKPRLSTPAKTTVFDVANYLTMPGTKNSGMIGRPSMMLAVSKNSKNTEMAVKFVNWMLNSPEAADILGTVRGVPMSTPYREELFKQNKFTPIETKAMKQIEATKIDTPSPVAENSRMQSWVREVFEKVALDKVSDQEAAKMLVEETNALMRRIAR